MVRKEIGGGKWITEDQLERAKSFEGSNSFYFIKPDEVHLSTCRSAIRVILNELKSSRKVALLPPFTCSTVVEPFVEFRYDVYTYQIDEHLCATDESFIRCIEEISPTVVFYHSLFGFRTCRFSQAVIDHYRQKGITFIEDYTPSLLSSFKRLKVDYCVGSIRKWLPIPDGGVLCGGSIELPQYEDIELVDAKLRAFKEKAAYLSGEDVEKSHFIYLAKCAEQVLDSRTTFYKMSDISKRITQVCNIDEIIQKRQENYKYLVRGLIHNESIFIPLLDFAINEVPFMMPILCKNKIEIQSKLAKKDIYATVLWAKPKDYDSVLTDEECDIYKQILCIPCNENYSLLDMDYIVKSIEEVTK